MNINQKDSRNLMQGLWVSNDWVRWQFPPYTRSSINMVPQNCHFIHNCTDGYPSGPATLIFNCNIIVMEQYYDNGILEGENIYLENYDGN
jgi:hypothetical protein